MYAIRSYYDSYAGIEKFLKRNPATCFVAEDDSRLIGVILSGHDGRRGYIYHAAVASDYRSRGIGTALVEHVVEAMNVITSYSIHYTKLYEYFSPGIHELFPDGSAFHKECVIFRQELRHRN